MTTLPQIPIGSPKSLSHILGYPLDYLEDLMSRTARCYTPFTKPKMREGEVLLDKDGNAVLRELSAINDELKQVQRRINRRILSRIPFPSSTMGGVRGRDSIQNARRHKGKKFCFCTDLQDFFPSVSNKRVYRTLLKFGFSPDVSRILTGLTTVSGSLPQGGVTSSQIGNLVLYGMDLDLIEWAKQYGVYYTRYIDDLTFSCGKDFWIHCPEVVRIIISEGFAISRRKTMYLSRGAKEITGVLVGNNWIAPLPRHLRRLQDPALRDETYHGLLSYVQRIT